MSQDQLCGAAGAVLTQVPDPSGGVSGPVERTRVNMSSSLCSCAAVKANQWDSPRCQQVADRVPGADEDLGLVAPQDHGLVLRDFYVPVHFHQVCVVI